MASSPRWPSENVDASPLGQSLTFPISGRTAPNRFMKAAMTERISTWDPKNLQARGIPTKELINLYRRWGEGGSGVILTGNILIDYVNLEAAGNPIIPADAPFEGERFDGFREVAKAAKAKGMLCVGQVSHAGRQVSSQLNPNPISASDVQLGSAMGMTFGKPRMASQEEIDQIVEGFCHAAEYLEKAGFDGIQLHGAHGYLLAQFLSPTTNQRTDKYGGSLENRARLITEIAAGIRKRTKQDFILGIKLNSVEFQESGFQPEEARQMCVILENTGFDFVELSGGTYQKLAFDYDTVGVKKDSTKKREAFFLEFAAMIAPACKNMKTYVTGGFKTVEAMVEALDTVDGVGIGRAVCQEPNLPNDILSGKVKGAIKMKFELNDFGPQLTAAGTHIKQIGLDQQPIDLSRDENFDAFMKDMARWAEKNGNNEDLKLYGWVDVDSVPAVPYGTAQAGLT